MKRPVRATYRLQLHPGWGFAEAERVVPRLARMGISHLYLSPGLEAVPGSEHGYDVVDPGRVREELGGREGLESLAVAAHAAGLGLVLDIVPNHLGVGTPANAWWWDLLAHGPESRYAAHFDVDWQPGRHGQPTLLLPQLGATLQDELRGGELRVEHARDEEPGGWRVVYYEHAWPVGPGTLAAVGLDPDDVEGTLAALRRDRGLLAGVLDRQAYRLAFWRRANEELDHRRFFDISTLAAVRIEDPAVFDDVHATVLELVREGVLDGLRIDHPDGLADPLGYFKRLRREVGDEVWIVVEKILEHGEPFRDEWPVEGTVGYEFAERVLGLHLDPRSLEVFDDLHRAFTGEPVERPALIDDAKRSAVESLFGAERRRLAGALVDALGDPVPGDGVIERFLVELLVVWPVYRTYVRPQEAEPDHRDREVIEVALAHARARVPELAGLVDRVRPVLLLQERNTATERFVTAFQQLTGPAIAKGVEDTVLYRDLAFVAGHEVGSDPGNPARELGEFHAGNAEVQLHRPATMLLSSSHDTKRSEDVRARLAVLSQDPDAWARAALELRELARPHRGKHGPTPAHQHLAFQTVVGAWPIDAGRLSDYLLKAAREGKQATSWLDPDPGYEADLAAFAAALVTEPSLVAAIEHVVASVEEPGWLTSLSMTLCKLASPGVPDVYQGTELWDLSLVDPDNRRPVDHELRDHLLAELERGLEPSAILSRLRDGLPKLWLLRQALRLREERPAAFGPSGDYRPLWARGPRSRQVAAFARAEEVVAVAPVRVRQLGARFGEWEFGETFLTLPAGRWRDVLTDVVVDGGRNPVAELLAGFPVALLAREA